MEPGYGSGYAPATGYGAQRREASFAVGLKGISDDDVQMIEEVGPLVQINPTDYQLRASASAASLDTQHGGGLLFQGYMFRSLPDCIRGDASDASDASARHAQPAIEE